MTGKLAGLTITRSGADYLIALDVADGEPIEVLATYDQLDLISEAIDEQLDNDEEDALEIDDGEESA